MNGAGMGNGRFPFEGRIRPLRADVLVSLAAVAPLFHLANVRFTKVSGHFFANSRFTILNWGNQGAHVACRHRLMPS